MINFNYTRVSSAEEALTALQGTEGSLLVAGGTDLVPLMKDELAKPAGLVDLGAWRAGSGIRSEEDGLHIGALTSLSEIAESPDIISAYTALADACRLAATPQLRNMGTIGGNLLQQTRCWYFRSEHNCWLKGGDTCFARDGENEGHSIFLTRESPCVSAHPSDPAAALLALNARVRYISSEGEAELPVEQLFALPEPSRRNFVTLPAGAVITEIVLPAPGNGSKSLYLKAMARATWGFALAGIAIAVQPATVEARIALSGVAPIPVRAPAAEALLAGSDPASVDPEALADALLQGAQPLSQNGYKLDLLRGLLKQAVSELASK